MLLPGRDTWDPQYRFGFNGKENELDFRGVGQITDYGMRIYNVRLGKFLSVDPLTRSFPMLTPYQYASNNPIQNVDIDGLEGMAGNLMHPGKWHIPGDADDNGFVNESESEIWGKLMKANFKIGIYGTIGLFRPQIGIPLVLTDLSGAPVLPAPQAMASTLESQAVRQTEIALDEAYSESATATTGTSGNNISKSTKTTATQNANSQATAANGSSSSARSNSANKPGPTLKTAGGGTINNSKWAGQTNPKAFGNGFDVPVNTSGYPDFSKYLYVKAPSAPGTIQPYNTVNI